MPLLRSLPACLALMFFVRTVLAKEDISFIAEHLPEVAMDNRYAGLPLDVGPAEAATGWRFGTALGYTRIETGKAVLSGPLVSVALSHESEKSRWTLLAFHDPLTFSGGNEQRPLDEPFMATPLSLPVAAQFDGLAGTTRDSGAGAFYARGMHLPVLGDVETTFGLLWQRVALRGYRTDYRILEGPQTGATGSLDFSATYDYVVPLFDIAKSFTRGNWRFDPHLRYSMPLPRRAMAGRITGPGFDLSGDTTDTGAGKHMGDPAVMLGFDVTYRPWNLSVDVGALTGQALLEPIAHRGVTTNWALAVRWSPR